MKTFKLFRTLYVKPSKCSLYINTRRLSNLQNTHYISNISTFRIQQSQHYRNLSYISHSSPVFYRSRGLYTVSCLGLCFRFLVMYLSFASTTSILLHFSQVIVLLGANRLKKIIIIFFNDLLTGLIHSIMSSS